jgi:hypothetical protein
MIATAANSGRIGILTLERLALSALTTIENRIRSSDTTDEIDGRFAVGSAPVAFACGVPSATSGALLDDWIATGYTLPRAGKYQPGRQEDDAG